MSVVELINIEKSYSLIRKTYLIWIIKKNHLWEITK